ncbi:hypothetical protein JCM8208_003795 [Rhodotorula glutinis]
MQHDGYEFLNQREPLEPARVLPSKRLPPVIPSIEDHEPRRDLLSSFRAQHKIAHRMSGFGLSTLHGAANTELSRAFRAMNGTAIIHRFLEWAVNELFPHRLGHELARLPAHTPSRAIIFRPDTGNGTAAHPLKVVCPALRVPVMPSPAGWVIRPVGAVGTAMLAGPTLVPVAGTQGVEFTDTARLWSIGQLRYEGDPEGFVLDSRSPNLPAGMGAYLAAGAPAVIWRPVVSPVSVLASCPAPPPRSTTFCLKVVHDPARGPPTHVHVEFDSVFDALVRTTSDEVRGEAERYAPAPRGEGRVMVWGQ